jgi:hypothetical protein
MAPTIKATASCSPPSVLTSVEQVDRLLDLLAGVLHVLERLGGPGVRRPRLDVLADDDDGQHDQLGPIG